MTTVVARPPEANWESLGMLKALRGAESEPSAPACRASTDAPASKGPPLEKLETPTGAETELL
eukprot:7575371-Alexandrium_andersonii.AAC.1